MKKYLIVIVSVVFLIGCGNDSGNKKVDSTSTTIFPPDPITHVLIMCDISRSMTPKDIEDISKAAQDLIKKLPKKAIFEVYPIEENIFSKNLLNVSDVSDQAKSAIERKREKIIKGLDSTLKQEYKERNIQSTCIVKSFKLAKNVFERKQSGEQKYNRHLVFISDMLEDCEHDFGRVNMETKAGVDSAISKIKSSYNPNFNLNELGVKLHFVIITRKLPITEEKHEAFWETVVEKLGYNSKEVINFTPDAPDAKDW
jgi:von Willebrand factor type A domain